MFERARAIRTTITGSACASADSGSSVVAISIVPRSPGSSCGPGSGSARAPGPYTNSSDSLSSNVITTATN